MKQNFPKLSNKETIALELLIEHGDLYGLELVRKSKGKLKRGTVYVLLGRMQEDKSYVESYQVKDETASGQPRRKYKITGHGKRVLEAYNVLEKSINCLVDIPFGGLA